MTKEELYLKEIAGHLKQIAKQQEFYCKEQLKLLNDILNEKKTQNALRPCLYTTSGKTKHALFHTWVNSEFPKDNGVIRQTLALIELESGDIVQAQPKTITFLDGIGADSKEDAEKAMLAELSGLDISEPFERHLNEIIMKHAKEKEENHD